MSQSGDDGMFKRFFSSRWYLLTAVVVLVLLGGAYARSFYQNYLIDSEITRLQQETERLRAKKMEMLEVIKYVKSSDYVEEKARTELNLTKEGEKVLQIKGLTQEPVAGQDEIGMVKSINISNPIRWWKYFFEK